MTLSEQRGGGDGVRGDAAVPAAEPGCPGPIGGDGAAGERIFGDGAGGARAPGAAVAFSAVDAECCPGLPTPSGDAAFGFVGVSADDPAAVSEAMALAGRELESIRGAIRRLRDLPLWTVGEKQLLDLAREVEATVRSAYGVQVRLAGEVAERGVAQTLSVRSAAQLLRQSLQIDIGDARARVAAATACLPSEAPSGGVVAPALAELLDRIDDGRLSADHARIITTCWRKIPAAVDAQTRGMCRDLLLDQAIDRDPDGLRQIADDIGNIVDPDGNLSGDPTERAELHIGVKRQDGLTPIRGLLSPLTAEQLRVAIEALAAPKPIDDHTPDPRPAHLRREQALGEIAHRHLTGGAGPKGGGVRPQVVVTVDWRDLFGSFHGRDPARPGGQTCSGGSAWSDYDGIQSVATARMLACDAAIIPQILNSDGVVLDQGRAARLFTPEQRRALTTRDRGCTWPGCDIPPAWCDSHHLIWWSHGGTTDIDNGALLCRRHHTDIHRGHWQIHLATDGRPEFVPPPHIDPTRKPRRNHHFHLPDLLTSG